LKIKPQRNEQRDNKATKDNPKTRLFLGRLNDFYILNEARIRKNKKHLKTPLKLK
jgi:hypothetical protein